MKVALTGLCFYVHFIIMAVLGSDFKYHLLSFIKLRIRFATCNRFQCIMNSICSGCSKDNLNLLFLYSLIPY